MNTRDRATVIGTLVMAMDHLKDALKAGRDAGDGVIIGREIAEAVALLDHAGEIAEKDGQQVNLPGMAVAAGDRP